MTKLYSPGEIARMAGVPVHQVQYAIRSRRIDPDQRGGIIGLYGPTKVNEVVSALKRIASERRQ